LLLCYSVVFSFLAAGISDVLKENITKSKYDKPTPIQKWAIPIILAGRDLMGCAQTGSGKTVKSLLQLQFDFDSISIQLRFDYNKSDQNYDSTAVRL